MKPKPAAPPLGLPWETLPDSAMVYDCNQNIVAHINWNTLLQRKRAVRIAKFVADAANATIKGEKP